MQEKNTGKMNTLKNKLNKIIAELRKFSNNMIAWEAPVSIIAVEAFENEIGFSLPSDYIDFLSISNGLTMSTDIVGIFNDAEHYDLIKMYEFEHKDVYNPMPSYLVPFSPDGFGNHYCFDTSRPTCNGKSCEIVFWQHDLEYDEKHVPEITHICFLDFIQEIMINDTLKYYDYDGNEKMFNSISQESKVDRSLLNPPKVLGNGPTFKKDHMHVEIHFDEQFYDDSFKELHPNDHRGKENFWIIHTKPIYKSDNNRSTFDWITNNTSIVSEHRINKIIAELRKFSNNMIAWEAPVSLIAVEAFENEIGFSLPSDYIDFLSISNGLTMSTDIVGIFNDAEHYDLIKMYEFEHKDVYNPMPSYLVPFSPDGFGNHYCFDTSRPTCNGKSCEIVFWQHDLEYDEKHVPEITHICFLDFIQEIMINDTLKYYDYDGNEK
ncbi:MAG: SMI1/KNR4 family protein [Muribaculaceae bacterium]|nr:SMI1/KNR4 family protein [Muribaculaceae bacterium]